MTQKRGGAVVKRILMIFLWLALAQPIAHGVLWVLMHLYSAFHEWFGTVFPLFSPISNSQKYKLWYDALSFIAFTISLFISTYLSVRFDNRKNEKIISRTDGLYTVGEAMPLYLRELYVHDILGSVICPLLIFIPTALLPEWFFDKDFSLILTFSRLACDTLGVPLATLACSLTLMIFHLPSAALALKRWRAAWLTGFAI